jgi:hypothetical protein
VERFVALQFLIPNTVGRTPWTEDQPVGRPLPAQATQTQNKRRQTSMPRVGFEPTIPVFERAKTLHSLDRAAIVIGTCVSQTWKFGTRSNTTELRFPGLRSNMAAGNKVGLGISEWSGT